MSVRICRRQARASCLTRKKASPNSLRLVPFYGDHLRAITAVSCGERIVSALLDRPIRRAEADQAAPPRWLRLPVDVWLCAGLLLAVLAVQAWNITSYPTVSDDEGTYLAQAWALQHGLGLAPYTYWYDHPPFGWMQIAATSWLPALLFHGRLAVAYARLIMLPVTAISSVLVYVMARRLALPRWSA